MQETRERIVTAALALFADKGFEATTVAEITEAADVGKGTFFNYFPSKDDVARHVSERLLARMHTRVAEAVLAGKDSRSRLVALYLAAAEWHEENQPLSRHLMRAALRSLDFIEAERPVRDQLFDVTSELVRAAQAAGELTRTVPADQAAMVLTGVYFGVFLRWHQLGGEGSLRALLERGLRVVLRGLEP